jgi:hypothetical protein
MSKVPKFQFGDCPPAKPAKVANLHPVEAPTLASLATLAGGKNENQLSTPQDETPQASPGERILTCAACGFHEYQGPNPPEGWERCTFKDKWCYGLRPACTEIKRQDTGVPLDG